MSKISRRQMLKALAIAAGGAGLAKLANILGTSGESKVLGEFLQPTPTPQKSFLPLLRKQESPPPTATHTPIPTATSPAPPTDSRVVHVYSNSATFWDGQTDYWNYVNEGIVDTMVEQGMMNLTGAATLADAWRALLPNYQTGQGIAIKINFNNAGSCSDADAQIDAIAEPVKAMVRGLKLIGVSESDIWIFEARRRIPNRFLAGMEPYNDVLYYDKDCQNLATFDTNTTVTFNPPADIPTPPETKIADVLVDATYLINVPIMKTHGFTGITLSFKNHFGSIQRPNLLHDYVKLTGPYNRSDYSVLLDLYNNPHIADKTILTVGDGLFACKNGNTEPPSTWATFGNRVPNSLFFSADPVAIDCVMRDFLAAETAVPDDSDDYLPLAANAGLGVSEYGDPWGSGYSSIDYIKIEL